MIEVLFVCLGNICRSPMAEAVFRHKVQAAGLQDRIQTDSAGTGDWHIGKPPHEGTRKLLTRKGIDFTGMKARQAQREDFQDFHYILAMDESNLGNLEPLAPAGHEAVVKKLMDFSTVRKGIDVPDPYYTGNFDEVYEMVDEACGRLLAVIREKEGL
ncbi:low molecular weight protein-tyrosine-phosphatase [Paenibacillus sp. y28]|uniref:low molecular weight protein-tyrosine-phosphatase n=1 Tax=Paenibacillus sp. y28 TaxID=3129110 RepID=UPI00301591E5